MKWKNEILNRAGKLVDEEYEPSEHGDIIAWYETARRLAIDVLELEDVIRESAEHGFMVNPTDRRISYLVVGRGR